MASFGGYLLKATKTGEIFPNKYILYESWNSHPNSREEIKAYRDENTRDLTRVTAAGTKSSFNFTVRSLHLKDVKKVRDFFTSNTSNDLQRRISLQYWNDETLSYHTADFYVADYQPKIKKITDDDIVYGEVQLDFVEY